MRGSVGLLLLVWACEPNSPRPIDEATGDSEAADGEANSTTEDTVTLAGLITHDTIALEKIARISRFRSAVGHDYSDDFESCRSMKHYFFPKADIDWATVELYAPFDGSVTEIDAEWAGSKLSLTPASRTDITLVIFHAVTELTVGDTFLAGETIGHHVGNLTYSDVAVRRTLADSVQLVSYFDLLSESAFAQGYLDRGVTSTAQFVISQEERDADPLTCDGEAFTSTGSLDDWVELN